MLGFVPVSVNPVSSILNGIFVGLFGVSANAQVGSFTFNYTTGLVGVQANAQVGQMYFIITNEIVANMVGVSANAQTGIFVKTIQAFLAGISANAQAGSFSPLINQEGLTMSNFICQTIPQNNNDTFVSIQYSDDGGISWGNPVVQSAGGVGQYLTNVQFRNLGQARTRVYRVRTDNPRPLSGIYTGFKISNS